MKVLLLAAGRGTRISRYLAGNPKCTVDIGGQKLIQYTIELFHKKGITDIAMVLGYRAEVIQERPEKAMITSKAALYVDDVLAAEALLTEAMR